MRTKNWSSQNLTCSRPHRTTVLHSITSPRNRTFAPILSIFLLDTATTAPAPPPPPPPPPVAAPIASAPNRAGLCSLDFVAAVLADLRLPPRLLVELLDRAGELSGGEDCSSSPVELLHPNLFMPPPQAPRLLLFFLFAPAARESAIRRDTLFAVFFFFFCSKKKQKNGGVVLFSRR